MGNLRDSKLILEKMNGPSEQVIFLLGIISNSSLLSYEMSKSLLIFPGGDSWQLSSFGGPIFKANKRRTEKTSACICCSPKCPQYKVINTPKHLVLGWPFLNSCNGINLSNAVCQFALLREMLYSFHSIIKGAYDHKKFRNMNPNL